MHYCSEQSSGRKIGQAIVQELQRGYIREGYYADLVLVNLNDPWKVQSSNILAKCGWSPFENQVFRSKVIHTFVIGHHVFENGSFMEDKKGQRLKFLN